MFEVKKSVDLILRTSPVLFGALVHINSSSDRFRIFCKILMEKAVEEGHYEYSGLKEGDEVSSSFSGCKKRMEKVSHHFIHEMVQKT